MTEKQTFEALGLPPKLLSAVEKAGYTEPSAIQRAAIPVLAAGRDLIAQAKTGTGKTAAFSLPLLAELNLRAASPQLLVLAPTRELALQVAEAIEVYGKGLRGLRVAAIFGGSPFEPQRRALQDGAQVVVGTPGRIQDHMRRGTLDLGDVRFVVLDEADEMLRMGFVEEVEAILEETPEDRQTALFSATMPDPIVRIAERFLKDPEQISLVDETTTVASIRQRYVAVTGYNKMEALARLLEVEPHEAVLVFVRTRSATMMVCDQLQARGIAASPLSGDLSQDARQRTVDRMKSGHIDIIVCTDVAARGLDVDRVSHVINYDMPGDTEVYVHRIGRTGRAGREGNAILFMARRERRLLKLIEQATGQALERMSVPTGSDLGNQRIEALKALVDDVIESQDLRFFEGLVERHVDALWKAGDTDASAARIAAALIYLQQTERPLVVADRNIEDAPQQARDRGPRREGGFARYSMEIGKAHGLEVKHVVGCIASEAGVPSRNIGKIRIFEEDSWVELPDDLSPDLIAHLGRAWVVGQPMKLSLKDGPSARAERPRRGKPFDDRRGSDERTGKKTHHRSFGDDDGAKRRDEGRSFNERPAKKGKKRLPGDEYGSKPRPRVSRDKTSVSGKKAKTAMTSRIKGKAARPPRRPHRKG